MGMTQRRDRRTRQPDRLVGVDWNNPLARGLRFLALPTDGTWTDVALMRRAALGSSSGNGAASAGAFGKSLYYQQANSYPQYLIMPDFKPATSDFWVLVSGTFESAALAVVALSNDAMQAGGANQWRLQPNYDGASLSGGSFSFQTYGGAFVTAGAASAFDANKAYTFLGVRRGTTVELWRDGVLLASSTGTAQNVSGSETQSVGFGFGVSGYSNTAGGHRFLGAGGLNTLTTAQAMELSRNPWQLFQPDMVPVFYTAAAPTGFKSAWAVNANSVLQGSLAA